MSIMSRQQIGIKGSRAGQGGGAPLAYPPASLERAVASIFLAGDAGEAARQDKLALLLYLLVDAGVVDLEAFRYARITLQPTCSVGL